WASQHPFVVYRARGIPPTMAQAGTLILATSSRNTGLALPRVDTCAASWVASSNHCDRTCSPTCEASAQRGPCAKVLPYIEIRWSSEASHLCLGGQLA